MKRKTRMRGDKQKSKTDKKLMTVLFILLISIFLISLIPLFGRILKKDELETYIKKKEFISFDYNFHKEEEGDITYRWLSQDGSINLVIPYDQVIRIEFFYWSYKKPRTTKLYLDDYLLGELNATTSRNQYISPNIFLKSGIYKLRLVVQEKCQVPALLKSSDDTRCISIGLGNFNKIEVDDLISYVDTPGWNNLETYYGKNFRWMEKEATLNLINLEEGGFELDFYLFSFYFDRPLSISVDENRVYETHVVPEYKVNFDSRGFNKKIKMSLEPGSHVIKFYTDSCDEPSSLGVSNDSRCISLAIIRPIIYQISD